MKKDRKIFLYAACWNHILGEPGILLYEFGEDTGSLTFLRALDREQSFGSGCMDEANGVLYLANEVGDLPGMRGGGGRVIAFRVSREDGSLTPFCEAPTLSPNPAYLALDSSGKFLLAANHSSPEIVTKIHRDPFGRFYADIIGSDAAVDLFEILPDRSVGRLLDVSIHAAPAGSGQRFAHPHSVVRSPGGDLFAVCDTGLDCIVFYTVDRTAGKLTRCPQPYFDTPGSRPRYGAFHPEKPYFYCNHEGEHTVSAFFYGEDGSLRLIGKTDALPAGRAGSPSARYEQQDFLMHPSGRWLYDLIHGPDASLVSVLEVGGYGGELSLVQSMELPGEWPRGAAFSPDGRFLAVSCMQSGVIAVCSVGADGRLAPAGTAQAQPGASALIFCGSRETEDDP